MTPYPDKGLSDVFKAGTLMPNTCFELICSCASRGHLHPLPADSATRDWLRKVSSGPVPSAEAAEFADSMAAGLVVAHASVFPGDLEPTHHRLKCQGFLGWRKLTCILHSLPVGL